MASTDDRPDDDRRTPRGPPPLRDLFSFRLRRLNLLYSRASALIYAGFGLTLTEWRLFAELHDTPQPRVPFRRLTEQTAFDTGLASRTVDALVAKGLVQRTVDASDARLREVGLTPQGRALGRQMLTVVRQRNRRLLSRLAAEDRAALDRILGTLIDEAAAMLAEEEARPGPRRRPVR